MISFLKKSWKILVFKGILLVLLSILVLTNPRATAATLVVWIAILVILDGIITLVTAIREWKTNENRWRFLTEGLLGIAFGLVLAFTPGITLFFIGIMIAFWFILTGVNRILMGIRLRQEIEGEGWVIFNGVLVLLLGLFLAARPYIGVESVAWLLGLAFLLAGIGLMVLGFKVKKLGSRIADKTKEIRADRNTVSPAGDQE